MLRLAMLLASKGLLVTFSVPEISGKQMRMLTTYDVSNIRDEPTPFGEGFIQFNFYEEAAGTAELRRCNPERYINQLELVSREVIPLIIKKFADMGTPVSCLINNPFLPWISEVAESLGLLSALFWIQSCASFSSYYHYHHNLVSFPTVYDPYIDVQLPCMPLLKHDELPSYLHPSTDFPFHGRGVLGQFKNLDKAFCILMETFEELEHENVEYISRILPIKTIGPLCKYPTVIAHTTACGGHREADGCIDWLDKKPKSSVVYVSFGTMLYFNQDQFNEIAYALLNSNMSFLWVIRQPNKDQDFQPLSLPKEVLERVGDKGKVVQWSPQEKVLSHNSIACFVTHCGWNSSLEALAYGVPIVAFPHRGDQVINAKYLAEVFKVGVKTSSGEVDSRLISCEEVEKCLLAVTVGPTGTELKQNTLRWKATAEAAVTEGGSSDRNVEAFIDELKKKCSAEVSS